MKSTCIHLNVRRCEKGLGGGRPSVGVCSVCDDYEGPDRTALTLDRKAIKRKKRPKPTVRRAFDWLAAMAIAGSVPDEVRVEREATCPTCDFVRQDDRGLWCSICGCGTTDESRAILNLARFTENIDGRPGFNASLPQWGCRHPGRNEGKGGWRR